MSRAPLGPRPAAFVKSVVEKNPRIAVFDCDGTLWAGDSGADFFYWELEQGLLPSAVADWVRARYDEYLAGRVDEYTMCAEMVTIHKGIPIARIREAVRVFFQNVVERRIFAELQELTHALVKLGSEVWAVSSTNDWVVEEGVKHFGIPANRVLAACVRCESGEDGSGECASDQIIRVPTDEHKATAIRDVIQRPVDAVFGNSMHDLAMLEIARDPYAINPNADLERQAKSRNWTVYFPETV